MTEIDATYPCPFRLPNAAGSDRPAAHNLHSHAGSLAYAMYDPEAHPDDADPTELIREVLFIRDLMDEVMRDVVDRARDAGQTWEQIGMTLGITKQAAQQRFGGKS